MRRLALVNVLMPRARELLGALGELLAAAAQQLQQGDPGGLCPLVVPMAWPARATYLSA